MRKGLPAHIVDSTQIPATNGHSEKKFTLADLRDIVSVGHILENPVRWLITDATQPEWDRIATIRAALAIA